MAQLEFNGKKIELDAQGYLLNSADWTPLWLKYWQA